MENRGLMFPFKGLIDECEAIQGYARHVLDKRTLSAVQEAKSNLQNIQASRGKETVTWQIPESGPLCTIWSEGESQPDKRSRHRIRAKFSFTWEIRRLEDKKMSKYFLLDGIASTVTTLVDEVEGVERCLARWAVEVGDHASPGVHFHFQIKGSDPNRPPFPTSLDIPRLPAPLMSPFLAIDLALGELFQDRWRRYATTEDKHTTQWKNIHQERLCRFFQWQCICVSKCTGSPWMALKMAKPPRDLLVEGR